MSDKISVELGEVQRTLLIPLFGRAKEFEKKHPLVKDAYAHDIVKKLDFDFERAFKDLPVQISINSAIRAYHLDAAVAMLLRDFPDATIVNVGAGLDTTFQRVDNGRLFWYDLDLPDSIDLRRKLIPETPRNVFIAKSVFDKSWFNDITIRGSKVFFIAAGVLMYLPEAQIRQLFIDLCVEFPGSEIVFDAYSRLFVWLRNSMLDRRAKRTSKLLSPWQWGVNSSRAIVRWSDKIRVLEEYPYFSRINFEEYWQKKELSSLRMMRLLRSLKMIHLRLG